MDLEKEIIPDDAKLKIKNILDLYRGLNKIKNLSITKISLGLTNQLYIINYDYRIDLINFKKEKLLLKIFGTISSRYNLIDREFETFLINTNSEIGLCAKCLLTDYKTYRLEEYLEDIKLPDDNLLYLNIEKNQINGEYECSEVNIIRDESFLFFNKLLDALINFEMSFKGIKFNSHVVYSIDSFLEKVMTIINKKVNKFELEYKLWREENKNDTISIDITQEKIDKIKYYVLNFEEIFHNFTLNINMPYILNHNDVFKYNLLIKSVDKDKEKDYKLLLIDYEFACLNYIGFDIVNYLIESFFDFEYPIYPFYTTNVKDIHILYDEDKKYFIMYNMYINKLILSMQDSDPDFEKKYSNVLKAKEYFIRISGVVALFWFYCSLIAIDFQGIITKLKFNYFQCAIDRISIYEKAVSILEKGN